MSTFRFEPIAIQLGKLVSLERLLPSDAQAAVALERQPDEPELPADIALFMSHYAAVARAGWQLLGAPQFARLSALYDSIEEEFTPGGPPMSPVYDSYSTQHMLGEVPHGLAAETPYTVLARLTSGDPRRQRLHRLAQALAASHLDLYRVTEASGLRARLEPLRGGDALAVGLTGPFLRTDDRMLARVLPFEVAYFIADSPYLLKASEQAWLDYVERVGQAAQPAAQENGTAAPRPSSTAKLSLKQLARRRQQQKAVAQQRAPDAAIVRHLQYGSSERYWLDYITDGYAGERRGIVYLAGVPDRPETLPHNDAYVPSAEDRAGAADPSHAALPPMPRLRAALIDIAERERITAHAERELRQACEMHGLSRTELRDGDQLLFLAYCTLGARCSRGLTALQHLERQGAADGDQLELIESLKRGWFSVLRVDRVHLDTGFEVLDLLRRKKLRISERSATRQVGTGDLLIGWLCEDQRGTLTLEGGLLHVQSMLAPVVAELAKTVRDQARNMIPNADWRTRASELPPLIILGMMTLREQMPLPELRNTSGHALQPATGRYTVRDPRRVTDRLTAAFERVDDHAFAWYDEARTLLATFELSGNTLLVRVNSHERLRAAKEKLQQTLGDAITPSLDLLEGDVTRQLRAQLASGEPPPAPPALPPELAPEIHAMVLQHITARLDEPVPMFQGKNLRQLARSKTTRPDAVSWLREQERFFKSNPQMKTIDMRPVWQELGLEYQGLDTDAP